ncbi:MAG: thiaminase II [Chloroflexi bacterium]|nr:thiaminase II [Chloroflexota bacterium]
MNLSATQTRSISVRLREAARPIWQRQLEHPFVQALCDGTLPSEVFEFYIRQDARFLDQMVKAFAYAVTKAGRPEDMQHFGERLLHTLQVEKALHFTYAQTFGLSVEQMRQTPMAPTNYAYTRHLLSIAQSQSLAALITAVLPCAWIYSEVGQHFTTLLGGPPSPTHPYCAWIGTYSTSEFAEVGAWLRARLEELTVDASEPELQTLEDIFLTSSRYEYMFWDMAWRREQWPV